MSVTRPVGQERRIGMPLRGYLSHFALLAGPPSHDAEGGYAVRWLLTAGTVFSPLGQ